MLYNNLKVLKELKKKGKRVGKLRYKKYMQFKMGWSFVPVEMERIRMIPASYVVSAGTVMGACDFSRRRRSLSSSS